MANNQVLTIFIKNTWAHHVWMNKYGVVIHPSADPETQMGQCPVHSDDKSSNIM